MALDPNLLEAFANESRKIVNNLMMILKEIKGKSSLHAKLQDYGNQVDRIMGGATSLALTTSEEHALNLLSEYTNICKNIAYKADKNTGNAQFYNLCVAFLFEGTATLQFLVDRINEPVGSLKKACESSMIERFRWVAQQIKLADSEAIGFDHNRLTQDDVDDLFKKMGG